MGLFMRECYYNDYGSFYDRNGDGGSVGSVAIENDVWRARREADLDSSEHASVSINDSVNDASVGGGGGGDVVRSEPNPRSGGKRHYREPNRSLKEMIASREDGDADYELSQYDQKNNGTNNSNTNNSNTSHQTPHNVAAPVEPLLPFIVQPFVAGGKAKDDEVGELKAMVQVLSSQLSEQQKESAELRLTLLQLTQSLSQQGNIVINSNSNS